MECGGVALHRLTRHTGLRRVVVMRGGTVFDDLAERVLKDGQPLLFLVQRLQLEFVLLRPDPGDMDVHEKIALVCTLPVLYILSYERFFNKSTLSQPRKSWTNSSPPNLNTSNTPVV